MNRNQTVSVRLTTDEKQRLEQASALAGYNSLGNYIRERLLADNGRDAGEGMAVVDVLTPLLFGLQREQARQSGVLAILLGLTVRKTTQGDLNTVEAELIRAQELGVSPQKLMALLAPEWNRYFETLQK